MRKHHNLIGKVHDHIMQEVLGSHLAVGQRLVFEDLARRYRVSRTPVNAALAVLAQQGYLTLSPHQGYTVRRFSRQDLLELLELKQTVEVSMLGKIITSTRGLKWDNAG